jgi:copper transport protein
VAALRRWTAAALVAAAVLVGAPRTVAAHAGLVSSTPAAGDTLRQPLARLRLRFSEPVEAVSSRLALRTGDGRTLVLTPRADPADVAAVLAELPALADGGYRVEWRILSADGHPVDGSFTFVVNAGGQARGSVDLAPPAPAEAADAPAGGPPGGAALLRGLGVGVLAAAAGLLLFLAWIAPADSGRTRTLAFLLAWAAPLLLAGHAAAWAAYAGVTGGTPATTELFSGTLPGRVEAARVLLALLALWALALARRPGLAFVFSAAAVVVSGWSGHSAALHPVWTVPARAVHVGALAVWIGGLLAVVSTAEEGEPFRALARRVSSLSLAAVVLITVTGVVQTILFVPDLRRLFSTLYGAVLLAKLVGFAALVALGARNRFRLIPGLPAPASRVALRRSVAWEIALMVLVLLAAGLLAYVPVPRP